MNEVMNADVVMKRVDECTTAPETQHSSHQRRSGHIEAERSSSVVPCGVRWRQSKVVHHVSGDGWRRVRAIVDSGSAECVAPESIAKNIPLVEIEASRQGQTYHTADGGVIKNRGENTDDVLRDW